MSIEVKKMKKMKKMKKTSRPVVQLHHIYYEEKNGKDLVVKVFRGEHYILTKMQQFSRKKVSKGFLYALREFIDNQVKGKEVFDL